MACGVLVVEMDVVVGSFEGEASLFSSAEVG